MNASPSCDRLWRQRLDELGAAWPDCARGRTKGLHRVRVASRRIREALPVIGVDAPSERVKKLARKVRRLTRRLGPIRQLDVELDVLEEWVAADTVPVRASQMLRREIMSELRTLRGDLAERAPVGDLSKLIRKLERVGGIDEGSGHKREDRGQRDEGRWRGVLAARLVRRAKELRAALDEAGPIYAPARLHQVRIAVKKLRYTLEVAGDVGLVRARALLRVLKREQERLGKFHDLEAVLTRARGARASSGAPAQGAELAALADALEWECRRLHAGFVEHRLELLDCTREVRQQLAPALTVPARRQARAVTAARPAARTGVRAR